MNCLWVFLPPRTLGLTLVGVVLSAILKISDFVRKIFITCRRKVGLVHTRKSYTLLMPVFFITAHIHLNYRSIFWETSWKGIRRWFAQTLSMIFLLRGSYFLGDFAGSLQPISLRRYIVQAYPYWPIFNY